MTDLLTGPEPKLRPELRLRPGPDSVQLQAGPIYHCFKCGAPARGLMHWRSCGSRLDAWAEHLAYLNLACACQGASRVARLSDWITPLTFHQDQRAFPCWEAFVDANVQALRQAVAGIAATVPADALTLDAPTRIVHLVLAGELPPADAIAQIRALLAAGAH